MLKFMFGLVSGVILGIIIAPNLPDLSGSTFTNLSLSWLP